MERRMMHFYLALDSLSYVLSDGRTLFSNLTEQFDQQPTGLVGCNGIGKTALTRILAGEQEPSTRRCLRSGTVHCLSQQVSRLNHLSVASLAGVQATLNALKRIEAGNTAQVDFDVVGDCWDVRQHLKHGLRRNELGHLNPQTPTSTISGGETIRVALIKTVLSDVDFLILDEPSNHLDRPNHQTLIERLQRWPNGPLLVSHDRQLLEAMARIAELSPLGLRNYGGGYSFYAQCKAQKRESAIQQLERKREEQSLREQCERQERRQARGNRHGREANQAKILLDRQKKRSEGSAGKLRQQQRALREQLFQRVRDAAQQVEDDAQITLHTLPVTQTPQRRMAALDEVELPFVPPALRKTSLTLSGQQRIGVVGPNGCGKSTLLKLLAGQFPPVSGRCDMYVATAGRYRPLAFVVGRRQRRAHRRSARHPAGKQCFNVFGKPVPCRSRAQGEYGRGTGLASTPAALGRVCPGCERPFSHQRIPQWRLPTSAPATRRRSTPASA
ncbi:ATP-binding cassette domain-containing protein [Azorhizophilus paspali]|uniref:ATP-binding cassette domain-containing protein n=1 Tax=Azorhizophilus paspali TaxID=69963 RepID=A0ABV6SIV7_AZOPA